MKPWGAGGRGDRQRRLRDLSVNKLIPNLITVMALCSGLSGLRFALAERWEFAVGFVLLAAILDTLDGRMARLLRAQSKFGAELDSLSDFMCFGVVPVCILFLWSLGDIRNFGWMAVLFFATCTALRLARFNVRADEEKPAFAYNFFTGVPAPAGAGAVLLPLILDFQLDLGLRDNPIPLVFWTVGIALLMVSQVPTFSGKSARIPQKMVLPVLIGGGLVVASLVSAPWMTLAVIIMVYLFSIPMSFIAYRRLSLAEEFASAQNQPTGEQTKKTDDAEDKIAPGAPGSDRKE